MRAVAPRTGLPEITLAEDQQEFQPITVCLWHDPTGAVGVLTRWRPSPDERERLIRGEDIYIALTTYGRPMQPLSVQVGPEGWEPAEPGASG